MHRRNTLINNLISNTLGIYMYKKKNLNIYKLYSYSRPTPQLMIFTDF